MAKKPEKTIRKATKKSLEKNSKKIKKTTHKSQKTSVKKKTTTSKPSLKKKTTSKSNLVKKTKKQVKKKTVKPKKVAKKPTKKAVKKTLKKVAKKPAKKVAKKSVKKSKEVKPSKRTKTKKVQDVEPVYSVLPSNDKIKDLINEGRNRGFITENEILYTFPDVEEYIDIYEDFLTNLERNSVEILSTEGGILDTFMDAGSYTDKDLSKTDASVTNFDLGKIASDSIQMYLREIGKSSLLTSQEEVALEKEKKRQKF